MSETMKEPKDEMTRRKFLTGAATSAAALAAASCAYAQTVEVVPREVLGGAGHTAPSEKLNIAVIGAAGRGGALLDAFQGEKIVAICDVDWRHAGGAFRKFPDARKYRDFREMLEAEKDSIDAVTVATPDHMHAAASLAAIRLGKHVYCEKPLTQWVAEARRVGEAAREAKIATQMGNGGQASEETRLNAEWIADGAIGPVREVHVWTDRPGKGTYEVYWPQGVGRPADTPKPPDTLSWDLWLGVAPDRPYNPAYAPFQWRGWWDFGTGALGDIGCHSLDPVFRALRLGHPTSVQASSSPVNEETYPLASTITYDFPERGADWPAVRLTWYDGGLRPPRPAELEEGRPMGTGGVLYVGDKGKILNGRLIPEAAMKAYKRPPKTLPRSPGHFEEWINACKGGEPAGSNFDMASLVSEVVLLGNVALRRQFREEMQQKAFNWDGANLQITNCPEANKYLRRDYREGWAM